MEIGIHGYGHTFVSIIRCVFDMGKVFLNSTQCNLNNQSRHKIGMAGKLVIDLIWELFSYFYFDNKIIWAKLFSIRSLCRGTELHHFCSDSLTTLFPCTIKIEGKTMRGILGQKLFAYLLYFRLLPLNLEKFERQMISVKQGQINWWRKWICKYIRKGIMWLVYFGHDSLLMVSPR